MAGLCILTPGDGYKLDFWQEDADDLRALFGGAAHLRCWDDPGLSDHDLILPLLAWDYVYRPDQWFAALDRWEAQGLRVANPVPMLRWNSDKAYLFELEKAGVPIVPTQAVAALNAAALAAARDRFCSETLVAKPAISGGAMRTYRLGPADAIPADTLGQPMLIQPLLESIASEGEYSLLQFGGTFSHAIVKRPAAGDFRSQPQFGGSVAAVDPCAEALACADAALAACPSTPLYARIDLVRDNDGRLALIELELIEPSLFLEHAPDGGARFVDAVRHLIG